MPRNPTKTTEEINSAASEAAKGAVVGAAKVRSLVQLTMRLFPERTTNKCLSVGSHNHLPRRCRLLSLAQLPQFDCAIQSLHPNLRHDSRRHDRC